MRFQLSLVALAAALAASPSPALAHCDSLDGPVVSDARLALESGDAVPALKWVRVQDEEEVRGALERALAVRNLGPDARLLADRFFFETLVRVHRQGEGAPFTGLKPGGAPRAAGIDAADQAVESGSAQRLVDLATQHVERGIRERFERAKDARAHAGESVASGRKYVAAYVELVHYAERLLAEGAHEVSHEGH